jgi:hypothetical protein
LEVPYAKLKCKKCGNKDTFVEDSFKESAQRGTWTKADGVTHTGRPGFTLDWEDYQIGDGIIVQQVGCGAFVDGKGKLAPDPDIDGQVDICNTVIWRNPDFPKQLLKAGEE